MAILPDSTSFAFGLSSMLGKASRAITGLFAPPPPHSAEHALTSSPMVDARLVPRVPMSNAELDVGILAQLSSIGLLRGKQVSDASHPELMRAWNIMSQRAGLPVAPQLIIAESDSLNAVTATPYEVTITTGLLKILNLHETCAVLGHELGHITSDHVKPRVMWMGGLGALGAVVGNEAARRGGTNRLLHAIGSKLSFIETLRGWVYPKVYEQKASSALGYAFFISTAAAIGSMIGRNISVRSTELDADAKGAAISGDPLAMASALGKMQACSRRSPFMEAKARIDAGYPKTEKRVENLKRIAIEQPMESALAQAEANHVAPATAAATPEPQFEVNNIASAERVAPARGTAIA